MASGVDGVGCVKVARASWLGKMIRGRMIWVAAELARQCVGRVPRMDADFGQNGQDMGQRQAMTEHGPPGCVIGWWREQAGCVLEHAGGRRDCSLRPSAVRRGRRPATAGRDPAVAGSLQQTARRYGTTASTISLGWLSPASFSAVTYTRMAVPLANVFSVASVSVTVRIGWKSGSTSTI
jgi:hypothetical protein